MECVSSSVKRKLGVPMGFGGALVAIRVRKQFVARSGVIVGERRTRMGGGICDDPADPRAGHPAREGDFKYLHESSPYGALHDGWMER